MCILKFFELLTKNFLGKPNPDEDFYESLSNSFAFQHNSKSTNNSNVKLLKQNNMFQNDTNEIKDSKNPKTDLSGILQTLIKKIVSFFGKRDQITKRDKAFLRVLLTKKRFQ